MYTARQRTTHSVVETLCSLATQVKFTFQGEEVDPRDKETVRHGLILLWLVWFDLLGSPASTLRSMRTWFKAMPTIPIDKFVDTLARFDEILLHCVDLDEYRSYTSVLREIKEGVWMEAGNALAPIKSLLASALNEPTVKSIAWAHQALVFIGRLSMTKTTTSLGDKQKLGWFEDDTLLYDLEPEALKGFFYSHFQYFSLKGYSGSHGPGNVYESQKKLSVLEKYKAMNWTPRELFVLRRMGVIPPFVQPVGSMVRRCRLKDVPKSCTKRRIISIEPVTNQWLQHGVRDAIVDVIKHDAHLRKHIDVEDDSHNAELALYASIDGDFVTIDLSKASDSVAWSTLLLALPSALRTALGLTRTGYTERPDGTIHRNRKFGGMGNATTFVVETLLFSSIVEQAIREAGGNPMSSRYRVHGDDIIVEAKYAISVLYLLQLHGFKINHLKTFTGRGRLIFRESCGMEALNGVDITPLRISRKFAGMSHKPEDIQGLVDFTNRVPRGYKFLRRYLMDFLLDFPAERRPLLSSYEDTKGVNVARPSNPIRSWRAGWQCNIVRHGALLTKYRFSKQPRYIVKGVAPHHSNTYESNYLSMYDESVRFFEYLRVANGRKRLLYPEDRIDVECDLPDTTYWGTATSIEP